MYYTDYREVMKTSFLGFYESYVGTCKANMKLQGHAMRVRY